MSETAEPTRAVALAAKAIFASSALLVGLAIGLGSNRVTAGALVDLGLVAYVLTLAIAPRIRYVPLALSLGGDIGSLLHSSLMLRAEIVSFIVVDFVTYSGHTAVLIDPTALIVIIEVAWALVRWARAADRG